MPLTIGDTFAGYRVLQLLGSGGMGEVYLAQHPRLPRQEALKVLRADYSQDESFRERFIREADLASGLRHPNVVGIHDRGEHNGQLWIAMDYIDGSDLSNLLARRYPQGMPVGHALPIVTAVASALDYAHKKGLLHRDIKPANIIVADLDTDDPKIYLADFGIARPLDDTSGITTTNMTVGTVAYAAPEQLMGEYIDGRADQYALAATTYHLLTGTQVFPHSNPAVVISRHLNASVPALALERPELSSLDPVLAAALAKNPDDRFACCTNYARALTETAQPQTVAAQTTPALGAHRHHASSSFNSHGAKSADSGAGRPVAQWLIVASVAVLLLLGVIGVAWQPWQQSQSNTIATSSSIALPTSDSSETTTASVPPPVAPPPVTATAPPPTSAVQIESGPAIGDECYDWMKFSTDSATGQEMICSGYPDDAPKMTWYSTQATLVSGMAAAPRVGKTGSPCSEVPFTFGRSSDGYSVWCIGHGALADKTPVWAKYSP